MNSMGGYRSGGLGGEPVFFRPQLRVDKVDGKPHGSRSV